MKIAELINSMKTFFKAKGYSWASDDNLEVVKIAGDNNTGYVGYSLLSGYSIGFNIEWYAQDAVKFASFRFRSHSQCGESKDYNLFAYEYDSNVITMYEYPQKLADIISRRDVEDFAESIANQFKIDCYLIIKRVTNSTMACAVSMARNVMEYEFGIGKTRIFAKYAGGAICSIDNEKAYDYYNEPYVTEIKITIDSPEYHNVYCAFTKTWNSENVQSYEISANENDDGQPTLSGLKLIIDRFGGVKLSKHSSHFVCKGLWQGIVSDIIISRFGYKKDDLTDTPKDVDTYAAVSEKADEVMTKVIIAITSTFRKMFNRSTITMIDLLGVSKQTTVDAIRVKEFHLTGIMKLLIESDGYRECTIIQKRAIDKATFHILWSDSIKTHGFGEYPTIEITKDSVTYIDGEIPIDCHGWQSEVLPRIKAICGILNNNATIEEVFVFHKDINAFTSIKPERPSSNGSPICDFDSTLMTFNGYNRMRRHYEASNIAAVIAAYSAKSENNEVIKTEILKDRKENMTSIQDQIKDVIFNDPATTVIWKDGTKTTVKTQVTKYQTVITSTGAKERPVERAPFDPEAGLAAAIMNKIFGKHSKYTKFVNGYVAKSEKRKAGVTKNENAEKKDNPQEDTSGSDNDACSTKIQKGLIYFDGRYIWTDGVNIYYSYEMNQYILDKSTLTWIEKTWGELTPWYGNYIWTDGNEIYYSFGSSQYVLDKSTSTWKKKTWSGLTSFDCNYTWTDGDNIYYSYGSNHYVLDKSTSTWSAKTWDGLTSFNGYYIWTDGVNVYYSYRSDQYVLDKTTSTSRWIEKQWDGSFMSFYGEYVWTDGENIYYSYNGTNKVFNKSTSTWSDKTWSGYKYICGNCIWTDGVNIYYSYEMNQYILDKTTSTWKEKSEWK